MTIIHEPAAPVKDKLRAAPGGRQEPLGIRGRGQGGNRDSPTNQVAARRGKRAASQGGLQDAGSKIIVPRIPIKVKGLLDHFHDNLVID